MAVNTNEDTRHCLELEKHPKVFLKEAETPDLKVFLLWVINNYKRIEAASSLKIYWRVLQMHIFDKTDRVFSESDKRDIRNVRYILGSEETWLIARSRAVYQTSQDPVPSSYTSHEKTRRRLRRSVSLALYPLGHWWFDISGWASAGSAFRRNTYGRILRL